jgi:hypothetical protein
MLCRRIEAGVLIKRIFAGSMVALLLSVASLTAACDLSCAFASMDSDCHSARTGSQDSAVGGMKMDGMGMAGMTMPEMAGDEGQQAVTAAAPSNVAHPSIGEMGPCEKQTCDNGSAVSAKTTRSVDSHSHSLLAVAGTSRADDALTIFHGARDDVASFRVRDGSPLHISLRI